MGLNANLCLLLGVYLPYYLPTLRDGFPNRQSRQQPKAENYIMLLKIYHLKKKKNENSLFYNYIKQCNVLAIL